MRDLKPGVGQAAAGAGLLLWGLIIGGVGIASAGIGIGIPLIPVGIYLIARGLYKKSQHAEPKGSHPQSQPKSLEQTGAGKFWLGMLLCLIGTPAIGAGIGIIIVAVGIYLVLSSLTRHED